METSQKISDWPSAQTPPDSLALQIDRAPLQTHLTLHHCQEHCLTLSGSDATSWRIRNQQHWLCLSRMKVDMQKASSWRHDHSHPSQHKLSVPSQQCHHWAPFPAMQNIFLKNKKTKTKKKQKTHHHQNPKIKVRTGCHQQTPTRQIYTQHHFVQHCTHCVI